MKTRVWKALAVLAVLIASLAVWALPTKTYAAEGDVARIGDVTYATLGEAFDAAMQMDSTAENPTELELLQSCEQDKVIAVQANKHLVITAEEPGITVEDASRKGITLSTNSSLLIENVTLNTNSQIFLNGENGSLTFSNATLNMDGAMHEFHPTGYYCGAIGLEQEGALLTFDNSKVYIKNYTKEGSAIRWNATDSDGYHIVIKNDSFFDATNCYAGITGTCYVDINGSTVNVHENRGNGANGSHFTITDSDVYFNNNGSHGLSAGILSIDHSSVTANGNGGNGIHTNNVLTISNESEITVKHNDCSISSQWTIPGAIHIGSGASTISKSTVTVQDNLGGGIYQKAANGSLDISDDSTVVVQGNTANKLMLGGGIYANGNVTLGSGVSLYNNHAATAGDDIYCAATGSVTVRSVGADWALDGTRLTGLNEDDSPVTEADDCTDAIDGWYVDAEGARWEAHASDPADNIVELYPVSGTTTVEGPVALKAAHGITATFTPADITIYMGGTEGYESVVQGSQGTGDVVDSESNSLPEPGFYIELPECINNALKAEVGDTPGAVDLSQYITMRTRDNSRSWTLEMYGATNSVAYDRFVYRVVSPEGQDPVRLQFTSGDQFFVSDEFDPSTVGALSNQYVMGVYPGEVDQKNIVMDVEIGGKTYTYTVELETGMLNVRYVTGEQAEVVTDVLASIEDAIAPGERAYAVAPEDTRYTINESNIDVTDSAAPSLLFDDVVTDDNTAGAEAYDDQLATRAQTVAEHAGADFAQPAYEAKYLDLVDANNGNVWIKASEPVTVYWPYPAGTDESTEFHLVHFEGLDRELSNGEISSAIDSANAVYVEVENTEHGVRFTTDGFSPFVLMWDASEPTTPTTPSEPSEPAKPNDNLAATGDPTMLAVVAAAAGGTLCLGASCVVKKHRDK